MQGAPTRAQTAQGPITGVAIARSVDERGQPVGRTFTFQPSDPAVTLVVRVGQLAAPSTLAVAWSAISDDDDSERPLFTQQIPVKANDQAVAIARSQGTLGRRRLQGRRRHWVARSARWW